MPVIGLPPTLECMLNTLLQELSLSSFKIEGRGAQTVIVLRLTQPPTQPAAALTRQDNTVVFRRKCPSQISRDRRRAEEHRIRQKASSSSSPSGLFLPTPPSLFYETGNNNVSDIIHDDISTCVESCALQTDIDQQYCPSPAAASDINFQEVKISDDCENFETQSEEYTTDTMTLENGTQWVTQGERGEILTFHPQETDAKKGTGNNTADVPESADTSQLSVTDLYNAVTNCFEDTSKKMDSLINTLRSEKKDRCDTSADYKGNLGLEAT